MQKTILGLALCVLTFSVNTVAQTNTFPTSGNVGIGTTNPLAPLDLMADQHGTNSWGAGQSGAGGLLIDSNNTVPQIMGMTIAGGNRNGASNLGWVSNMIGVNTYYDYSTDTLKRFSTNGGFINAMALTMSSDANQVGGNRVSFWTGNQGDPIERAVITATGNVGIGTTNPVQKLEVAGYIQTDAGLYFAGNSMPQTVPWTGVLCGGDYAESVDVVGDRTKYGPGDLLVIDSSNPGKFLKSAEPYSPGVAGIYSTEPGVVGRRQTTAKSSEEIPMAVVGIVPAKVSAENGPIRPSDLLVSSKTAGYAMKGTDRALMLGAVVGKAMGSLDSGVGVIEVLVTLQ